MSMPSSRSERMKRMEKKNTLVMWIVLAIWLGLSLLGQALFIDQNPRLDAGAILVSGAGPILIISALVLLFWRILSRGLVVRLLVGILSVALGVGELTNVDKGIIWGPAGIAALMVVVVTVLVAVSRRRNKATTASQP